MSSPREQIRPLLAGRLRPFRRPPSADTHPGNRPILRISHSDKDEDTTILSSASEDSHQVLGQIRSIASALRTAQEVIEIIQHHLMLMVDLPLSTESDDSSQKSDGLSKSEQMSREIQVIDGLVLTTCYDGQPLLNGKWSVNIFDPTVKGIHLLRIPSMFSYDLGNSSSGGMVSSLSACDAWQDPAAQHTRRQTVLRSAILQAAAAYEQVAIFQRDAVEPLIRSLEVASANMDAAFLVAHDMDFAHQTSQLTQLDALIHTCANNQKKQTNQFFLDQADGDEASGDPLV